MEIPRKPKSREKDQLFCWIEKGENEYINLFLKTYAPYIYEILAQNNWNILMYACRYGNIELVDKLWTNKNLFDNPSGYTYVHAACFGNDLEMLRYLVDEKQENVNPFSNQISENTPLRFACKAGYHDLIEYLVKRGAFYYDDVQNYCNNCAKNDDLMELRFKTLDGKDILQNFVVRFDRDHIEPEIKDFIRFIQRKNFYVFKKLATNENAKNAGKRLQLELSKFRDPNYLKMLKQFIG